MEISDEVKIFDSIWNSDLQKNFLIENRPLCLLYYHTIHNLHKGNNLLVSYGERLDTKIHSAVATTYLFLKVQETRFFLIFRETTIYY